MYWNISQISLETSMLESLFNKIAGLRLQHRCFPVKLATFLGIYFSAEHLWWLKSKKVNFVMISFLFETCGFTNNPKKAFASKICHSCDWNSVSGDPPLQYLPKWIIFSHFHCLNIFWCLRWCHVTYFVQNYEYNKSASYFISPWCIFLIYANISINQR